MNHIDTGELITPSEALPKVNLMNISQAAYRLELLQDFVDQHDTSLLAKDAEYIKALDVETFEDRAKEIKIDVNATRDESTPDEIDLSDSESRRWVEDCNRIGEICERLNQQYENEVEIPETIRQEFAEFTDDYVLSQAQTQELEKYVEELITTHNVGHEWSDEEMELVDGLNNTTFHTPYQQYTSRYLIARFAGCSQEKAMKLREMYDDNNYFAGVSGTKESPDRGMKIHTAMSVRDRRFVELLDVVRNVAKRNNISWKVWLPNEWSSDNLMEGKSVTMYPSTDEETDNPSMASNLNHTMEVAKELDTELFERGIRRIGADIAGTDMEIGNTKDTSESVSIRFGQLSHKDRIYPDGWQDDRSRSMAHNLPRDIDMQQILDAATEQGLELR